MTPSDRDRDTEATQAPAAEPERIVLRFSGEVTTKAPPTRRAFVKRLAANLRDALRSEAVGGRLVRTHDRIYADVDSGAGRAAAALARVPGVQSLSRGVRREWSQLDDLVEHGVDLFGERVHGLRFGVRARRLGDRRAVPFRSAELERSLGTRLLPASAGVDLTRPDLWVQVEIGPGEAHFFSERIEGPGGLPLGAEGRAVALLSGGFDSAVAAWQVMKRGVGLDYVLCNLGGRSQQLETLAVAKHLADAWSYGWKPRLHVVDFDPIAEALQARCTKRMLQVVLKRLMLRAGEAVACQVGAHALVTGDALGQVSSQTLVNLDTISRVATRPVLRPLVGANKEQILAWARHIGTYDLSVQVGEYCALVPSRPATQATPAQADAEEAKLPEGMLEKLVAERSIFDLRALDLAHMERPDLETSRIPEDAVVIDLRSKAAFASWHWPGALFLDFPNALRAHPHFEKGQPYVLYCEFGLKSAHLADLMRRGGLDASHIAGGAKALRDLAG